MDGTDGIDANKRIVTDFLAAFSRGDVEGVLDRMHARGAWQVMGRLEGMSGSYDRAALGPLLHGVKGLYRHGCLPVTVTAMIGEGAFVAVEATSHADLVDGRIYANQYHFLFEVADGKVLLIKEYMDTLHAKEIFFPQ